MTLEGEQAVFWRRAEAAASPRLAQSAALAAAAPSAVSAERRIMILSKAIEQLYESAPGWDKYALEQLYVAWAKDKEPAHNEDARFIGWVKTYTKGKPSP